MLTRIDTRTITALALELPRVVDNKATLVAAQVGEQMDDRPSVIKFCVQHLQSSHGYNSAYTA